MRPVNLIPPEERRGGQAPLRTGPLPYVVLGALVAVLAGVTALVLIGNQIADRKSEIAQLKQEDTVSRARAERLVAYSQFHALREQRVLTIASLADSRFDWERVMRELSLVLPHDVWLVKLTGKATPEVGGGSTSALSSSIVGPSLEIEGCATGQEALAGFVTALKEIDGVTRVGVQSSELSAQEGAAKSSEANGGTEECRTHDFITKFQIVSAFDAAPVPEIGSTGEAALAPATEPAQTTSTETSEGSEGETE